MFYSSDYGKTVGVICILMISACDTHVRAPVESPVDRQTTETKQTKKTDTVTSSKTGKSKLVPDSYSVKRGDTLYSIAWNYGYDYRDVAAWNNINKPYTIYPGQRIKLKSATESTVKRAQPLDADPIESRNSSSTPKVPAAPASVSTTKPVTRNTVAADGKLQWSWPTQGKMVKADTPISKNGIDIAGTIGQEIKASASGDVVYSGSGLLGYGKLIIIKHNDIYLSAYAHNSELLVTEGDQVKTGQLIAKMGQTSNGRTILHFEIRKNGQPVSPLTYLPAQ